MLFLKENRITELPPTVFRECGRGLFIQIFFCGLRFSQMVEVEKMKKNLFAFWLFLGLCVTLVIAGYTVDRLSQPKAQPYVSEEPPYVDMAEVEDEISLVGPVVKEWLNGETTALDLYTQYRSHGRVYTAMPVKLQWGVYKIPDGAFITRQFFELATTETFEDASRYELRAGERSIELPYLLVDTQYYYRVTLELENSPGCVTEGTFTTAWSPRILELEDLRNIRDIGGWKTTDGKTVRQGLLYRGCELDGATETKCVVTKTVADILVQDMKIKSELDLRSADTKGVQDMLGADVKHQYFALPSYAGTFTDAGNQKLRAVFSELAVEENYPVYLHCTKGADRTGIVCYLLEALLGMSEEDCYRDWELSVLDNGNDNREVMNRFVETLKKYEGETLREKTENYLLSIQVTQEEIDSIRSILTTE